ncbi:threonine-phosphate decarboxylase CobD [Candidatus Thiosymbion oneisti]|uniref:threonine-phosphate decarboxylase CobD n=1 Tax=Candidatus Thiosymbion oneisti TaxID=589554 RepID=UPI000AF8DA8F|nr:threonine-phosphate decarboxylase CobD [Candidatus Thiosymbion oneisti]
MLEHGGRLRQAARRYGIPIGDWLDLSTGINPCGWPVPEPPRAAWSRLPEDGDGLEAAAQAYYGAQQLLAVAGSQAAIQALPRLRDQARVSVLDPGYFEHAYAWRCAGHQVTSVTAGQLDDAVSASDVLVLIHPNNPTGARFPVDELLAWQARLAAHGGWLVVDEAFMDATPEASLARFCPRSGLILLRSLGKFFGLAGARVGFVLAQPQLLERLTALLGPWAVSSPARWVATQALADRAWQQGNRRYLAAAGERLVDLLTRCGLPPDGGCGLFQWVRTPAAVRLQDRLAQRGILTRLFTEPPSLRFGLPGTEADWARLEAALADVTPRRPDTLDRKWVR